MRKRCDRWYLGWALAGLLVLLCTTAVGGSENRFGYKLGPRDIIATSIFAGGEQQVAVDLTISDGGNVNFPFLGTIKAQGLAVNELEKQVSAALAKDFFINPQVHIQVREYHSLHFSISGAVRAPGNYKMESATTIMDLIARAGGVTPEKGNVAYILRENLDGTAKADKATPDQPLRVDLYKLLDQGDASHNVMLQPGDSVYIPLASGLEQTEIKIYVSGQVVRPDLYDFQPGLTALSACIKAGGFARYAAPNRTTIVRTENGQQKVIKIDLQKVVQGKEPDFALKPGDRIHVPESWL